MVCIAPSQPALHDCLLNMQEYTREKVQRSFAFRKFDSPITESPSLLGLHIRHAHSATFIGAIAGEWVVADL